MSTINDLRLVAFLRGKLGAARYRLSLDLPRLRTSWRRWRDWRTHIRVHPYAAGALAALLGFIVVPKRQRGSVKSTAASLVGMNTAVGQKPAARSGFVEDATRRLARLIVEGLVAAAFREVALARARKTDSASAGQHPAKGHAGHSLERDR